MNQNMNGETKSSGMIHKLSGIAALLCIVMMFVPAAEDALAFYEYHYRGEMLIVCSRAVSGFYESEVIWKVLALIMIVVVVLLLLWSFRSFRHPENIGKIGLVASVANLLVSAFMAFIMLFGPIRRVFIIVPVLIVLMAVIALVLAVKQRKGIQ